MYATCIPHPNALFSTLFTFFKVQREKKTDEERDEDRKYNYDIVSSSSTSFLN